MAIFNIHYITILYKYNISLSKWVGTVPVALLLISAPETTLKATAIALASSDWVGGSLNIRYFFKVLNWTESGSRQNAQL
jgi:hypothetical protein